MKAALLRLLWCALNPAAGLCRMPLGWCQGRMLEPASLDCADLAEELRTVLGRLSCGDAVTFCSWVESRWNACAHPAFDGAVFRDDLVTLLRAMFSRP